MRRVVIVAILVIACSILAVNFFINRPLQAVGTTVVVLKSGNPVALRLTEKFSPKTHNIGDVIHFEVVGDVTVNKKVVISSGTPAEGEITVSDKQEILGKPERLAFIVRSTTAVDGTRVPIRATLTREGISKETKSLGLGLFICPFFIFEKGGVAEFPAGTEIRAYVDYDTEITVE